MPGLRRSSGLAIMALLFFAQARETSTLRDSLGGAAEHIESLEGRLQAIAALRRPRHSPGRCGLTGGPPARPAAVGAPPPRQPGLEPHARSARDHRCRRSVACRWRSCSAVCSRRRCAPRRSAPRPSLLFRSSAAVPDRRACGDRTVHPTTPPAGMAEMPAADVDRAGRPGAARVPRTARARRSSPTLRLTPRWP